MKKITLIFSLGIASVMVLSSCTSQKTSPPSSKDQIKTASSQNRVASKKYYSYLDNLDLSKVDHVSTDVSLTFDPTIPASIKSVASNIFIARVTAVEKADVPLDLTNLEPQGQITPFTYLKLDVLNQINGKITPNSEFVRSGGVMQEKDIYKYDYPAALEQIDYFRVAAGKPKVEDSATLLDIRYEGDVYLEAGKVYLMFAIWNKDYNKYEITGFQYGSLELEDSSQPIDNQPNSSGNANGQGKGKALGKTWKVKNVSNGQEKNLGQYLKDDLGIDIPEQ